MRTRITTLVIVLLSVISGGCATTLKGSFLEQAEKEGWTKEQQYTAFYYGLRLKFLKENPQGGYDVYYAVLTNKQALTILETRLEDLKGMLDYKNKGEAKYLEEFGLRAELEREERTLKAVYARLRLLENFNDFKANMGDSNSYQNQHSDRGFNSAKIFVEDVAGAYPFTSTQVEEARAGGSLKEIERIVWFSERTLGKKEPDPDDPEDPNKFIWKPVKVGVEFVSYKILGADRPKDNMAEYVEGTRLEVADNGNIKRESKPSLRLFLPNNGYGSVLVIDKDKEGEIGFLLPDFVERVGRVATAQNLMNDSVLSRLFYEDEQSNRIPPKTPPPITVTIAPVGGNKIDVWETNPNGWTVPMRYKNNTVDNYSVGLKLKGSDDEHFDHSKPNKQIEYFRKNWDSAGNVVEYFHPKPPYNEGNIEQISAFGKDLSGFFANGDRIEGRITSGVNKFIQDRPYAIAYAQSDKRWMLRDEDGDGKYEGRRELFGANGDR
ncbi:MAG: hypothetical protein HYT67_00200 [Candidatus Yanofskybacteria bacterium]|nr:hypothetical protein [Candidatus Yanofskybacteria bacterium]